MYLTYQVKELTLPDFKNYDGSSIFTFPRDLPLMMIYFPMLEKVTLRGETFSTDELLKDKTAARWIKAGHVQFGRLPSLGGGLIPDSGIKPSVNIPAIPESMFRPSLKGPDTKILDQGNFYSLFTLGRKFGLGYPNPGLPLDPKNSAVCEYINSINGDPIRLEQITASEGFDQDASYMISSFRMNGDIRTDVRICLDPQVPFHSYHQNVLSLPEWVCDGALRFGTNVFFFLHAVSKVRPELFDSYKPENHTAAAEPLPPAGPAVGPAAAPVPVPAVTPEDTPNPPAINFCPYCGARVKGYKSCVKCGRKLIK